MTAETIAAATAEAVEGLGRAFLTDPTTYTTAADKGFAGLDFYVTGRAGVLGDVDADVAAAAMAFIHPGMVRTNWEAGTAVMPARAVSEAMAASAAEWADEHLGDGPDWSRLAELTARVTATASIAGAPLFAGWRSLDVPAAAKQAAMHQLFVLRELRMARHAAAIVAHGIDTGDAVRHRTPAMLGLFGWAEAEVGADVAERWQAAEAMTNVATGRDYAALSDAEGAELSELCAAALAAVAQVA